MHVWLLTGKVKQQNLHADDLLVCEAGLRRGCSQQRCMFFELFFTNANTCNEIIDCLFYLLIEMLCSMA